MAWLGGKIAFMKNKIHINTSHNSKILNLSTPIDMYNTFYKKNLKKVPELMQ